MRTTIITGVGNSPVNSGIDAMTTSIRNALTSYSNVSFVKRVEVDGRTRDIYSVSGFNHLYFSIQNANTTNAYLTIRVYKNGNEEQASGYQETYTVNCKTSMVEELHQFSNPLYTFSKNNVLYAFAIAPNDAFAPSYVAWGQDIMYISEIACIDDSLGSKYYINRYSPLMSNTEVEKAVFTYGVLTSGQSTSKTTFGGLTDVIKKFVNEQFWSMNFSLIQVGDKRYRQVYQYYLFVENGDDD